MALRMIKRCINAELDGDATLMYYLTEEYKEGKKNVRTENELSLLDGTDLLRQIVAIMIP